MKKNYKPGQILYIRSSMGPWYYISVLKYATPSKRVDNAYELHTCCDLCVDEDDGNILTFECGNGSLLDLDTVFAEVREATNEERIQLFDALVRGFKNHDLGWANHFTDSSYFDILDWLSREFNVDFEDDSNQNHPLCEIISEIQDYIWDELCKETGNYQACTDYEEPEMVNKQEFIEKAKSWVKNCFVGPFDEGMANNIANEFEKYMEA